MLQVIPAVASRYGGPSRAILEMSRALLDRGVEVLVLTTDADGDGRLDVELGKPVDYQGVPTVFFARQWSEALKYSRPLASWAWARAADFDVVHIHAVFSHSSLAATRACRRGGVAYIVRPCGALDPWSLTHKRFRKNILWFFGVRQMLRRATLIHYTTAAERKSAEKLGLAPGVVIPVGVDEQLFETSAPLKSIREILPALRRDPYVLTLCRLHSKKGLELLLDAFLDVTSEQPLSIWRLVIAGDGEASYVQSLRNRIERRGAQERILLPGWLQGSQRISALREAGLFTLASFQENFGIAVAEALASRVPVVVSDRVGLAEDIAKEAAGWVVPLEPAAVRRALANALRDEAARLHRGNAGYALALRCFRWQAVANEVKSVYERVRERRFDRIPALQ